VKVNRRRSWRRDRKGLTLIELLGAIAMLGLMGIFLLPRLAPISPAVSEASTCPYSTVTDNGVYVEQARPSYIGIGAAFSRRADSDGYARIARPFADGPAERAGVEPGDLILRVDGVSVQYTDVDTVVGMIRDGEEGAPVQLTLGREGESDPVEVTITRERVFPPSWRD
jgi:S1-C subfamily serine protease